MQLGFSYSADTKNFCLVGEKWSYFSRVVLLVFTREGKKLLRRQLWLVSMAMMTERVGNGGKESGSRKKTRQNETHHT